MAGTGFTKRDANRYKKIYPFIRRTPRNTLYAAKQNTIIEIAYIDFDGVDEGTHDFLENFSGNTPIVTVSVRTSTTSVNPIVTAVSPTSVTVGTSENFTGSVAIHAIYIPS